MQNSRTDNAIRNIIWGYLSKIIGLIAPFILRTVMIYKLGGEYVGINSLFTSILQVLNISELGIGTAIVYSMYQPIVDNDTDKINALLHFYRTTYRVIGSFIMLIGLFIVPFIPKLIAGTYPNDINIYIVYTVFLLDTAMSYLLFAYRNSLFLAFQRNDIDSKISLIFLIITNAIQVIVVWAFHNYYCYLFIIILFNFIQNVIRYTVSKKMFWMYECDGYITDREKNVIKENVKALVCHKIGGTILNSADTIVISAFLGVQMLTKYTNYYYIISSVEGLIMICFSSITAGIGNSFILESKEKNAENFNKVLFLNGMLVITMGTVLATSCQTFVQIWVGESFIFDDKVVVLLINYYFVHAIRRTIITFRDGAGAWKDNQFQPIVSGGVNLLINILMVMKIGIYGIILSSIICMLFIDIPWETSKFIPDRLNMKTVNYYIKLIGYFLTMWMSIGISFYILNLFNVYGIVKLFSNALISFFIVCFAILIIYGKTSEFMYFITLIKRKIFNTK